MNEIDFETMCRGASFILGVDDPEQLARDGYVDIDSVRVGLFFDEQKDSEQICCYVDIGEFAENDHARVNEQLLKLNLLTGSKTAGVFALDPMSGHPVLVVHLRIIEDFAGAKLAQTLRAYVTARNELRAGLLLTQSPAALFDSLVMTNFA
jgi:hypothetical protein